MLRLLTALLILAATQMSLVVNAQNAPVAAVKYKLANFKNPSRFKGRLGLTRFSPDDKNLAVLGDDNTIVVYDAESGKESAKVKPDQPLIYGFAFGESNKTVLLQDNFLAKVDVFDAANSKFLRRIDGRSGVSGFKKALFTSQAQQFQGLEIQNLPLSPDRRNLLIAKSDGAYQIVDASTGEIRFTLNQFSKASDTKDFFKLLFVPFAVVSPILFYVSNASYNADGTRVVLANGDKIPTLWEAETGKLLARLEPQTASVYTANFSADGKLIATTDTAGITKIWNAETGAAIITIGTKQNKEFAAGWSPTTELLVTYTPADSLHFYEARTGKLTATIEKAKFRRVIFSPDGKLIVTLARNNKSTFGRIWNVADGRLVAELPRLQKEEHALSFEWSANSKILAAASDESVKLYSDGGKLLQTLDAAVFPARFSSDGKLLATGGKNDVGFVWQIEQ